MNQNCCEYAQRLFTAHNEMKRRGWGFARNKATGTYAVGPMDDLGFVLVKGMDTDFVKAMEKALGRVNEEESHA